MMIARIPGHTRLIGKGQGYLGLPVRDELINCATNGSNTPSMTTAWEPDPKELEAIRKGAKIHVRLLGTRHPPIMVEVGEVPE